VVEAYTFALARTYLLNTVLTPLPLPAKVIKKMTNQWSLSPGLRRALLAPLAHLAVPILRGDEKAPEGGLVFI